MELNPQKINTFLFFNLPSAWICGVRLKKLEQSTSIVRVRHRWINQNPFKSLYFAVQSMAAELSTGVLVMRSIKSQNAPVSMLVIESNSKFYKKATGVIHFECHDGEKIHKAVQESIQQKKSVEIKIPVKAYNKSQEVVADFYFVWSIKPKNI